VFQRFRHYFDRNLQSYALTAPAICLFRRGHASALSRSRRNLGEAAVRRFSARLPSVTQIVVRFQAKTKVVAEQVLRTRLHFLSYYELPPRNRGRYAKRLASPAGISSSFSVLPLLCSSAHGRPRQQGHGRNPV